MNVAQHPNGCPCGNCEAWRLINDVEYRGFVEHWHAMRVIKPVPTHLFAHRSLPYKTADEAKNFILDQIAAGAPEGEESTIEELRAQVAGFEEGAILDMGSLMYVVYDCGGTSHQECEDQQRHAVWVANQTVGEQHAADLAALVASSGIPLKDIGPEIGGYL